MSATTVDIIRAEQGETEPAPRTSGEVPERRVKFGVAAVVERGRLMLACGRADPPEGHLVLPGGKVNFGETMYDAVVREVLEETGIQIKPGEFLGCYEMIEPRTDPTKHHVVGVWRAEIVGGQPQPGDDVRSLHWIDQTDAGQAAQGGLMTRLMQEVLVDLRWLPQLFLRRSEA